MNNQNNRENDIYSTQSKAGTAKGQVDKNDFSSGNDKISSPSKEMSQDKTADSKSNDKRGNDYSSKKSGAV